MEIVKSDYSIENLMNATKNLETSITNFKENKCKESIEFITSLKQLITNLNQLSLDYNNFCNKSDNSSTDDTSEECSEMQIQHKVNMFKWVNTFINKYEDFEYWLYFDIYQDFMLFYRTHPKLFIGIISIVIILLSILFYILWF